MSLEEEGREKGNQMWLLKSSKRMILISVSQTDQLVKVDQLRGQSKR